jgi:hypothetical protein
MSLCPPSTVYSLNGALEQRVKKQETVYYMMFSSEGIAKSENSKSKVKVVLFLIK